MFVLESTATFQCFLATNAYSPCISRDCIKGTVQPRKQKHIKDALWPGFNSYAQQTSLHQQLKTASCSDGAKE